MSSPSVPQFDQFKESVFHTYWDSLYEETLAGKMIQRWSLADEVTKILVAATASGSAIAGWTVWNNRWGTIVWAICSGVAAILSVVSSSLAIPTRIKAHAEDQRRFASLRTEIETFWEKLNFEASAEFDKLEKQYLGFRQRYSKDCQALTNDSLRTTRLEKSVHMEVQTRLKHEIKAMAPVTEYERGGKKWRTYRKAG